MYKYHFILYINRFIVQSPIVHTNFSEMQNLSVFLTHSGEPIMSTSEYWTRFTFVLLMGSKNIQIDQLLLKAVSDLTENEKLHLMIAKATFLSTIGERTIETLQNRNPKDKLLEEDQNWLKTKWEEICGTKRRIRTTS